MIMLKATVGGLILLVLSLIGFISLYAAKHPGVSFSVSPSIFAQPTILSGIILLFLLGFIGTWAVVRN